MKFLETGGVGIGIGHIIQAQVGSVSATQEQEQEQDCAKGCDTFYPFGKVPVCALALFWVVLHCWGVGGAALAWSGRLSRWLREWSRLYGNERGSWTLWGPRHITSCEFSRRQCRQAEPHRQVAAEIFVPWSRRGAGVLTFPGFETWSVVGHGYEFVEFGKLVL